MNQEHKSQDEILQEIGAAKAKIAPGATYAHYKDPNKRYLVKEFATLESTNELCVIYRAQYGAKLTFVRPVGIWLEEVEWQGKTVPRFKKLG